ncbi:MAG: hypothetical protein Q8Q35_02395 [Nanoarchaeota archaeon]|nr:hypothetical protein [Nanoarchaeota archaeon]
MFDLKLNKPKSGDNRYVNTEFVKMFDWNVFKIYEGLKGYSFISTFPGLKIDNLLGNMMMEGCEIDFIEFKKGTGFEEALSLEELLERFSVDDNYFDLLLDFPTFNLDIDIDY